MLWELEPFQAERVLLNRKTGSGVGTGATMLRTLILVALAAAPAVDAWATMPLSITAPTTRAGARSPLSLPRRLLDGSTQRI